MIVNDCSGSLLSQREALSGEIDSFSMSVAFYLSLIGAKHADVSIFLNGAVFVQEWLSAAIWDHTYCRSDAGACGRGIQMGLLLAPRTSNSAPLRPYCLRGTANFQDIIRRPGGLRAVC